MCSRIMRFMSDAKFQDFFSSKFLFNDALIVLLSSIDPIHHVMDGSHSLNSL